MRVNFTKMHGLGNDFMVLDLTQQPCPLNAETIRAWSNRKTGIGFDQLLVVETATAASCDFRYRIYNADGSEVENCGNGVRCVASFILKQGLSTKQQLRLQMQLGSITTDIDDHGLVTVDMQMPILNPVDIPFNADSFAIDYSLRLPEDATIPSTFSTPPHILNISAVSMGNPHSILLVEDVQLAPVDIIGPLIENHSDFPNKVNVGFMQICDSSHIRLRVFERGVGETHACGTGACAAVVAGRLRGLLDEAVTVDLIGGTLNIFWPGKGSSVFMTGPATTVFEGQIDL